MKTPKKRIKLRDDGYYYPQSSHWIFWLDYDDNSWYTSCASVRFSTFLEADEFLAKQEVKDLRDIELAKQAKTFKWKAKA